MPSSNGAAIFVSPDVLAILISQEDVRGISAPAVIAAKAACVIERAESVVPHSIASSSSKTQRMLNELEHALRHIPSSELSSWVQATVWRFGSALSIRLGRVVDLAIFLVEVGGRELIDLTGAITGGKAIEHISSRSRTISDDARQKARALFSSAKPLIASLRSDPQKVGPALMVGALAAYTASGGLDADGGAPDLDIALLGIDAHRSLFTHSILAGALVETGLVSLIDLIQRAHTHLPPDHDPLWDTIRERARFLGDAATRGASVGLAYHLGVDGLIQPGAYHDLPFAAPIEVHQGILTINAIAEGRSALDQKPENKKHKRDWNAIVAGVATAITAVVFWG